MKVLVDLSIYTPTASFAFGTCRLEFNECPVRGDSISLARGSGFAAVVHIREFLFQPRVERRIFTPGKSEIPILVLEDVNLKNAKDAMSVVDYLVRAYSFDMEILAQ